MATAASDHDVGPAEAKAGDPCGGQSGEAPRGLLASHASLLERVPGMPAFARENGARRHLTSVCAKDNQGEQP